VPVAGADVQAQAHAGRKGGNNLSSSEKILTPLLLHLCCSLLPARGPQARSPPHDVDAAGLLEDLR
jgi:hypothetical protein